MSPARGRWQKCEGSIPRRGLSGAASGGLRGAGERYSFLPTVPSSLPLSRVSARVPATACLESPRLSRGRCGGMRGAERGGCQGVGRAVPAFFFALLHFFTRTKSGSTKLALLLQGGLVLRLCFRAGTGTRVGQSRHDGVAGPQ